MLWKFKIVDSFIFFANAGLGAGNRNLSIYNWLEYVGHSHLTLVSRQGLCYFAQPIKILAMLARYMI